MRSSLVITGIFTGGLGVLFYVLEIPFVFSWSFPFMVGGLVFALAGAVAKETAAHIDPPSGHIFCAYCNTPIPIGTKKCDRCNGTQPP